MAADNKNIAYKIKIEGLVQGVGFRPFIFNLALDNQIRGYVMNLNDGVEIHAEGGNDNVNNFISSIQGKKPFAAEISGVIVRDTETIDAKIFEIRKSKSVNNSVTQVSPDIAVCDDCMFDLKTQRHRLNYPLINCTNCGPRFSIIDNLPYDRENTTMQPFIMCNTCRAEYDSISDRRFHAQPVACNNCGPEYQLIYGKIKTEDVNEILNISGRIIKEGKIVAIKGTGGFHLMCDALDEHAVSILRNKKVREHKPFAVMFRSLEVLKEYTNVSTAEENSLLSWRRPIVILKLKKPVAPSVTAGLNTIGAFLPYMPFHYLFFEESKLDAVVLTSGNVSDEPVIIDNSNAFKNLQNIADSFIFYNRDIRNRTDDSVVKIMSGKERVFRRSRGYAPSPVIVKGNVEGILATGAELSNCFCIGKGNQAIMSQHIGDLKNQETYEFYLESIENFKKLYRFDPRFLACDMHPDYLSSRYVFEQQLEVVPVQHHHAHVASCMAENNLDEKVIGICFDGAGYGTDGNIWGSEFFIADYKGFERFNHFEYTVLPGGDLVSEQPWRTALSYLYKTFGNKLIDIDIPFIRNIDRKKAELVIQAIDKKINCPLSSGSGRLFDAVAALLNITPLTTFHAEAPMRLESEITKGINGFYDVSFHPVISFNEMFRQIVNDMLNSVKNGIIAAKFHNTVVHVIEKVTVEMAKTTGLKKIVLSGGTFQNKYIMEKLEPLLIKHNFEVYTHSSIPCNDGGIALGQLMVTSNLKK